MDNLLVKTLLDSLHVLATVLWFGGMFINFIVIRPSAAKTLNPETAGKFQKILMQRFRIIVYVSIVVLGITGIPMKIVSEHYAGIVSFDHIWGTVSFVKHLIYGVLVLLAVINFEVLAPRMAKAAKTGDLPGVLTWKKRMGISGALAMSLAITTLILSSMMRYL